MKRHIPGLHGESQAFQGILDGVFLVSVDRVFYRWHPQRPFYVLRLAILEPREHRDRSLTILVDGYYFGDRLAVRRNHVAVPLPNPPQEFRELSICVRCRNSLFHDLLQCSDITYYFTGLN